MLGHQQVQGRPTTFASLTQPVADYVAYSLTEEIRAAGMLPQPGGMTLDVEIEELLGDQFSIGVDWRMRATYHLFDGDRHVLSTAKETTVFTSKFASPVEGINQLLHSQFAALVQDANIRPLVTTSRAAITAKPLDARPLPLLQRE
jgi:hypothetical protein